MVNNEQLPPIHDLTKSINSEWLCDGLPSQFHGDFILDNIIETNDGFCLIDWRQDFAGDLEVGDIYYDLAKLNHNLTVNHDLVNRNLFDSSTNNCYILTNSTLNECQEILHNFIIENGYDLKKVKVLTSLIWINMAPLHEYPFNNFLFNFGKYNLYKNLI
jgi:aminoglycoside phosphotransferase (APT) family kinase protein